MKKSLLPSTLLASLLISSALHAGEKIVGGEPVKDLKEVSYMVSLSGACGGSILSSKWVLTAAHCVGYFREVKGGVLNLKEEGVKVKVKRTIKHPEYNPRTLSNDFALVELEEEIDFEKTGLAPVRLATKKFEQNGYQDPGTEATVYGFGNLGSNQSNYKKDLNKVAVPIVSHEDANRPESYNGAVDDTMLPAGFEKGGKDSCQGDSGGPLVVFNHRNEAVQVGVVSWGAGCAARFKYGIYSKVSHGYEWIKKTMAGR